MGSGPLRIGQSLELGEDLYSMFFASTLNPKYVYYHKDVVQWDVENDTNSAEEDNHTSSR